MWTLDQFRAQSMPACSYVKEIGLATMHFNPSVMLFFNWVSWQCWWSEKVSCAVTVYQKAMGYSVHNSWRPSSPFQLGIEVEFWLPFYTKLDAAFEVQYHVHQQQYCNPASFGHYIIHRDYWQLYSLQAVWSSLGTLVVPSHGVSAEQWVASPGVDLISFPVQRVQELPLLK